MANHLNNEKSTKKGEQKSDEKPEDALAMQDFPLNEALNLLKGINIVKRSK